jgi:hypothetical protein
LDLKRLVNDILIDPSIQAPLKLIGVIIQAIKVLFLLVSQRGLWVRLEQIITFDAKKVPGVFSLRILAHGGIYI